MSDLFAAPETHLEKSCDYLLWRHIAGAVLDVFRQNQRRETEGGLKASADTWATCSPLRADIASRACTFWCRRTGLDALWFPYSEDGIARLYFRFRKRNDKELLAFEAEINTRG